MVQNLFADMCRVVIKPLHLRSRIIIVKVFMYSWNCEFQLICKKHIYSIPSHAALTLTWADQLLPPMGSSPWLGGGVITARSEAWPAGVRRPPHDTPTPKERKCKGFVCKRRQTLPNFLSNDALMGRGSQNNDASRLVRNETSVVTRNDHR